MKVLKICGTLILSGLIALSVSPVFARGHGHGGGHAFSSGQVQCSRVNTSIATQSGSRAMNRYQHRYQTNNSDQTGTGNKTPAQNCYKYNQENNVAHGTQNRYQKRIRNQNMTGTSATDTQTTTESQ